MKPEIANYFDLLATTVFGDGSELVRTKLRDNIKYVRRRGEFRCEALLLYVDYADDAPLVNIQLCLHCFGACPIPSGPFGEDGYLGEVADLCESGLIDFEDSQNWYRFPDENTNNEADLEFRKLVKTGAASAFAHWDQVLAGDPIVEAAIQIYSNIVKESGSSLEDSADVLEPGVMEALIRRSLGGGTTKRGYSVEKVSGQMRLLLRGNKYWFMG